MPRQKLDKFSVAVTGSGRLLAPLITDGMAFFPNSAWYDRTDTVTAFVKQEVALGKSRFASPEFRKSAARTEANLRNPQKTDVTVAFRRGANDVEWVTLTAGKQSRVLSFPPEGFDLDQALRQLIQALMLI